MITQSDIEFIGKHGYLNLGKILTDVEVDNVNTRIAELEQIEGDQAGAELFDSKYIRHPSEAGATRLADLVNKGAEFDVFYTHPKVIAGIKAVLGQEIKLSSLNYRAAKPGMGLQKLHVDWKDGIPNGNYKVCNSIWLLDDFTNENGPTRIVPGSHKFNQLPQDVIEDQQAPHPEEIKLLAPAGSVFIFNSHAWHGGTTNLTDKPRRSMHSYFCTRDQPQQIDQKRYITADTKSRLTNKDLYLLDV